MAENLADGKVSISADLAGLRKFASQVQKSLQALERGDYSVKLKADDKITPEVKKVTKKVDELGRKKATPKLTADDKATGILDKVGKNLKKVHGQKAKPRVDIQDDASPKIDKISGALKNLVGGAAITGGLYLLGRGAKALAGEMVTGAGEMERYDAILTTVLGSAEAAGAKLEWASKFAATTPFELPGIVEATTRLEAYGLKAEDVLPSVGDAAAAMGKDLMSGVEAIADAQTGEFERLKEFGIKAVEVGKDQLQQYGLKADAMGKTMLMYTDKNGKEAIKLVDRNNREMVTSNLTAIWNEKYQGAMDRMSKTWEGTISNLKDTVTRGMSEAGQSIIDKVQPKITELMATLQSPAIKEAVGKLGEFFGEIGSKAIGVFGEIAKATAPVVTIFTTTLGPAIGDLVEAVGGFATTLIDAGVKTGAFKGIADNLATTINTLGGVFNFLSESGIAPAIIKLALFMEKVNAVFAPFLDLIGALKTLKEFWNKAFGKETIEGSAATGVGAMQSFWSKISGLSKKNISDNQNSMKAAMWGIADAIVKESPVPIEKQTALMEGLHQVVNKYGTNLREAAGNDIIAMAIGISAQRGVPIGEVLSILQQMGANVSGANLPGGEAMHQFALNIAAASGLPVAEVEAILNTLRTNAANAGITSPVDAKPGDLSTAHEEMRAWFAARPIKQPVEAAGSSSAGHTGGLVRPDGIYHGGGAIMRALHRGGEVIARLLRGEYVMRNSAVDKYGLDFMEAVNRGLLPSNCVDGLATVSSLARSQANTGNLAMAGGGVNDNRTVNIYNPVFPGVRSGKDADDLMRQVDKRTEAAVHLKRVWPSS